MVRLGTLVHWNGALLTSKPPLIPVYGLAIRAWLRYHMGMDKESIDNLARRLADAVPDGLKNLREEMEMTFRSVLSQSLAKLDLVTREEFEVQEAVLRRTREKLDALEKELKAMESR